jgi:hypothetical protein
MRAFVAGGLVLGSLAVAGCTTSAALPPEYQSVGPQVMSYYNGRAMEMNAACPNPRMDTITASRVVEESPEQVRMDIRYHWTDESRVRDLGNGGSVLQCGDFSTRTFTFERNGNGLTLVDMSGEQKRA